MGALLKNEQDTRAIAAYLERGGQTPKTLGQLGGRRR